jgi:hypothetical protein
MEIPKEKPSAYTDCRKKPGEKKWITFKLDEQGNCEGLQCVVHFNDGSKMNGIFNADNVVEFENVSGNYVEHIDIMLPELQANGSIVGMWLSKLRG